MSGMKRGDLDRAELFEALRDIVLASDPIQIGATRDEYDPEIKRLVPRLSEFRSADELHAFLHRLFVEMFDSPTAGPPSLYRDMADEIWRLIN